MSDLPHSPTGEIAFLRHILQVFGLDQTQERLDILVGPAELDERTMARAEQGGIVVAIQPGPTFVSQFGLTVVRTPVTDVAGFVCRDLTLGAGRYRSLHASQRFEGEVVGEQVLVDEAGRPAWLFLPKNDGGILLVGTALVADLLLYRQGDPKARPPRDGMWGIAGERPVYLFEHQVANLPRYQERQADFWSMILARFLATKLRSPLVPILPSGAPGAVIITGDDDQAELGKYAEQLKVLGDIPVTYFMHPLTKHTRQTVKSMLTRPSIDFGIHPDALEAPHDYAALLHTQSAWFEQLFGKRASSVRNHGFLNDGYWGHLQPWLDEGIDFSSNIPGLDGFALNGSLLPARVYSHGHLTGHWSVLTAIGDGVRYVNGGRSDAESANCIFDLADAIRQSAIPGVIVLNLHPQNVGDTRAMHLAAREVIRSGFLAWNMRDCFDWFAHGISAPPRAGLRRKLDRLLRGLSRALFCDAGNFSRPVDMKGRQL